ncbi:unnamed protein product [Leptosia nina]|uniref:Uncharacterized protein n=1 Tax=Leptosia nina TaxID=320188 RepID=A0AAV1IVQ8_9NEOP
MESKADIDKLVENLSFQIVTAPCTETIVDNVPKNTHTNGTPVNVKIKYRHRNEARRGVISVPKLEYSKTIDKLRRVNSDQTLMSFNLIVDTEAKKPTKKSQKKVFQIFKPGICLSAQSDDDDYPYNITKSFEDIKDTNSSNRLKLQNENTTFGLKKNNSINQQLNETFQSPKAFLGKCKPGGCLDPPFGEEKYAYKPAFIERHDENNKKFQDETLKTLDDNSMSIHNEDMKTKLRSECHLNRFGDKDVYDDTLITYPSNLTCNDSEVRKTSEDRSKKKTEEYNKLSVGTNSYLLSYYKPIKSKEVSISSTEDISKIPEIEKEILPHYKNTASPFRDSIMILAGKPVESILPDRSHLSPIESNLTRRDSDELNDKEFRFKSHDLKMTATKNFSKSDINKELSKEFTDLLAAAPSTDKPDESILPQLNHDYNVNILRTNNVEEIDQNNKSSYKETVSPEIMEDNTTDILKVSLRDSDKYIEPALENVIVIAPVKKSSQTSITANASSEKGTLDASDEVKALDLLHSHASNTHKYLTEHVALSMSNPDNTLIYVKSDKNLLKLTRPEANFNEQSINEKSLLSASFVNNNYNESVLQLEDKAEDTNVPKLLLVTERNNNNIIEKGNLLPPDMYIHNDYKDNVLKLDETVENEKVLKLKLPESNHDTRMKNEHLLLSHGNVDNNAKSNDSKTEIVKEDEEMTKEEKKESKSQRLSESTSSEHITMEQNAYSNNHVDDECQQKLEIKNENIIFPFRSQSLLKENDSANIIKKLTPLSAYINNKTQENFKSGENMKDNESNHSKTIKTDYIASNYIEKESSDRDVNDIHKNNSFENSEKANTPLDANINNTWTQDHTVLEDIQNNGALTERTFVDSRDQNNSIMNLGTKTKKTIFYSKTNSKDIELSKNSELHKVSSKNSQKDQIFISSSRVEKQNDIIKILPKETSRMSIANAVIGLENGNPIRSIENYEINNDIAELKEPLNKIESPNKQREKDSLTRENSNFKQELDDKTTNLLLSFDLVKPSVVQQIDENKINEEETKNELELIKNIVTKIISEIVSSKEDSIPDTISTAESKDDGIISLSSRMFKTNLETFLKEEKQTVTTKARMDGHGDLSIFDKTSVNYPSFDINSQEKIEDIILSENNIRYNVDQINNETNQTHGETPPHQVLKYSVLKINKEESLESSYFGDIPQSMTNHELKIADVKKPRQKVSKTLLTNKIVIEKEKKDGDFTNFETSNTWNEEEIIKDRFHIDFALQMYVNDEKIRVLKTIDPEVTSISNKRDAVMLLNSKLQANKDEIKIPVDPSTDLVIFIKKNLVHGIKDTHYKNSECLQESSKDRKEPKKLRLISYELKETISMIYEQNLVPVENMLKALKEDVDILVRNQILLKETLRIRTRSARLVHVNRRCACYRK